MPEESNQTEPDKYVEELSLNSEEAKPDWCPLRELPEKKTGNSYMNSKETGIVEGWNAFLDAIEGGAHE